MKIANRLYVSLLIGTLPLTGLAGGASDATMTANSAILAAPGFPFKNDSQERDARKGYLGPLKNNGKVIGTDGKTIWDTSSFEKTLAEDPAPATVNPSLWRMNKLVNIGGVFEVKEGLYQVRNQDLSNLTIIETPKGLVIADPLISEETARNALESYFMYRPKRAVVAIIYSHSHVDHFGGVRGIVNEQDIKDGKIAIYAPAGFMEHAIAENIYAGYAMSRRSTYMYGNLLPQNSQGQVGAGLGMTTSTGTVTLIAPTHYISEKWETHDIGGMKMEFMLAPGSEAPSEMHWYMPDLKVVSTAENATHNFHNLYTPRGAKTRDARLWPKYLNQTMQRWGDKYEALIGMHHWPVWGQDNVTSHLKNQRDVIKYTHDRVLHLANLGYTIDEVGNMIEIPESILNSWSTHPYYGGVQRNARSVYNFYLGYFDGNPATIVKLAPEDRAKAYADAFGVDALIAAAQKHYESGNYPTASEFGNMAVFAAPDNEKARQLQADILEQLGYQAETGPNRNFFLGGAAELRQGVKLLPAASTASADVVKSMSMDMIFDFMGISLDSDKAVGKSSTIQWNFTDTKENYTLFLENSVLNYWSDSTVANPDTTLTLSRTALNKLIAKQAGFKQLAEAGEIKVTGDPQKLLEILSLQTDFDKTFWFNIVTP